VGSIDKTMASLQTCLPVVSPTDPGLGSVTAPRPGFDRANGCKISRKVVRRVFANELRPVSPLSTIGEVLRMPSAIA